MIMLEKHLVETELKFETLTLEYESAKADLEKINDSTHENDKQL